MQKIIPALAAGLFAAAATTVAIAATETVTVNAINDSGIGAKIGTVRLSDTKDGLMLKPNLKGLPPGSHGFHIHVNPSCAPANGPNGQPAAGFAAGGHFDPANTGKHLGPLGEGHKGDLPVLVVDDNGMAKKPVIAPHLKLADVHGRSIMIHAGGDNYSDQPAPLGGGGARIACGVIK
jgi:superoxide dismutase, Cu-Zn family